MISSALVALATPWPWYVAGPLIGLFVPALLLVGNRMFGVSSSLRHACAAAMPGRVAFFSYDWRSTGGWNLAFVVGIVGGGVIASRFLDAGAPIHLSAGAQTSIAMLGIHDMTGLVPRELFHWSALLTWRGLATMVGGGFLIGFGTAYAGGCTSGHAISGLADFQLPSLVAVLGFFAGGLIATWLILPRLLGGGAVTTVSRPTARLAVYFTLGVLFGVVLTKSEVISWFRIQEMFRFQSFHMYGIIGSAVVVAAVSLQLIKRLGARSLDGAPIVVPPKAMGHGTRYWLGGLLFGLGWALVGACPGPLFALVGAGVGVMAVPLASALVGTWVYGTLRPRLPH